MTARDQCAPAEDAEDGSLHWVEHPRQGLEVWRWFVSPRPEWLRVSTGNDISPVTSGMLEWKYLHPASPTDAADLAVARAYISELEAVLKPFSDVAGGFSIATSLGDGTQVGPAAIICLPREAFDKARAVLGQSTRAGGEG